MSTTYLFWMNALCAIYLVDIKAVMKGDDEWENHDASVCLYEFLSQRLKIMDPMIPLVTEELYRLLTGP